MCSLLLSEIYFFLRMSRRPDLDGFHALYPYGSIYTLGLQLSQPLVSSDASLLDFTTRVNLSTMDMPASMKGRQF